MDTQISSETPTNGSKHRGDEKKELETLRDELATYRNWVNQASAVLSKASAGEFENRVLNIQGAPAEMRELLLNINRTLSSFSSLPFT